MLTFKKITGIIAFLLVAAGTGHARFVDSFDHKGIKGWFFFTGDGAAVMDVIQMDGHARILVDATRDRHNVWWAVMKRDVTEYLDLDKLADPGFELRAEARVRVSEAPRRINIMVNTQRTTDFHKDLMEFDIPDTSGWHTISMTTRDLDAHPGDTVYVQLDVTDWGTGRYHVDVDYYTADIIDTRLAGPDKGELVPYHPPLPDPSVFSNHPDAAQDGLINTVFPDVNFSDWHVTTHGDTLRVLTVNHSQWAILRWDFGALENAKADGAGLLELTTHSVFKGGGYTDTYGQDFGMEFGKIRVIEITGGDPRWTRDSVTYNNLILGKKLAEVFNSQMIYDAVPSEPYGSRNLITLSRPVLQRLLDGKTRGLLIRPLGAINASFFASGDHRNGRGPKLHFNIQSGQSETDPNAGAVR